jgi:hypothetical protein
MALPANPPWYMPCGPHAPGIAGGWEITNMPPGLSLARTSGKRRPGSANQAAPKIE